MDFQERTLRIAIRKGDNIITFTAENFLQIHFPRGAVHENVSYIHYCPEYAFTESRGVCDVKLNSRITLGKSRNMRSLTVRRVPS